MARRQYLQRLQERYARTPSKKEKGRILDEYCRNTGQNRKYVIRKIQPGNRLVPTVRKRRHPVYNAVVKAALTKLWEIFDYPCGQRLAPLLKIEVERLIRMGELSVSESTLRRLRRISSATIDRLLQNEKKVLRGVWKKGLSKPGSLLSQKIPVRLNDWDTAVVGNLGIDFVEHCGASQFGEYINSLCVTDISSGWWEAEALMGRGQQPTFEALKKIRQRTPFVWREIHPDNERCFINHHLYRYCRTQRIRFSRSRPYKKNDNCYVEQKNWTHIKKVFGYLRYDTQEELRIIQQLYQQELRLYKNFFQPVMKLKTKTRLGGKVHRTYDTPKTPYLRLLDSPQIPQKTRRELQSLYSSLNPAYLKRSLQSQLDQLFILYQNKHPAPHIQPYKKLNPHMVTNYMIQPVPLSVTK